MDNKLIPSFAHLIFEPDNKIWSNLLEVGIDGFLNNEALQGLPVVRFIKIAHNIREWRLVEQTAAFIEGLNSDRIADEERNKHSMEFEENPRKAEKELGRIIILLDDHVEKIQSEVLGRFYSAYLVGKVSWMKFCELSEVNRRMFVSDYPVLIEAFQNDGLDMSTTEPYQVDRLISLGLLKNTTRLGGDVSVYEMKPGERLEDVEYEEKSFQNKTVAMTSLGKVFAQNLPKEYLAY